MPNSELDPVKPTRRRERSARYPGATLLDAIELAREMGERGVDGLPAASVAAAMGYKNIKTQTFSARLSAARQFGLIGLREGGYGLTELARAILHPLDPAQVPALRRQAFLQPSLYADLCEKLEGRKVPDVPALANWLYHHHQITASAKDAAAEVFLSSAREVGVLGDDGVLRIGAVSTSGLGTNHSAADTPDPSVLPLARPVSPAVRPIPTPAAAERPPRPAASAEERAERRAPSEPAELGESVDFVLRLWGPDEGKVIQLTAPAVICRSSFERLLQTLKLMVRIEDD
jgi:hypothetical protein